MGQTFLLIQLLYFLKGYNSWNTNRELSIHSFIHSFVINYNRNFIDYEFTLKLMYTKSTLKIIMIIVLIIIRLIIVIIIDLAWQLNKLGNMRVTAILIEIGVLGTVSKGIVRRLQELEIGGRIKTIQTTTLLGSARLLRKVLGNLRRLAVTQIPVKDSQLTLAWKTCKE